MLLPLAVSIRVEICQVACQAVANGGQPAFAQMGFGAAAFAHFVREGWWALQGLNL